MTPSVVAAVSAGALTGTILGSIVLVLVLYVWLALALSVVFRKVGVETWKAWVPVYNIWCLLEVGGYPGWIAVGSVIPFANVVVWVFVILAAQRINRWFGYYGIGMTVLAALLLPVWASILGFGPARWLGRRPRSTGTGEPVPLRSHRDAIVETTGGYPPGMRPAPPLPPASAWRTDATGSPVWQAPPVAAGAPSPGQPPVGHPMTGWSAAPREESAPVPAVPRQHSAPPPVADESAPVSWTPLPPTTAPVPVAWAAPASTDDLLAARPPASWAPPSDEIDVAPVEIPVSWTPLPPADSVAAPSGHATPAGAASAGAAAADHVTPAGAASADQATPAVAAPSDHAVPAADHAAPAADQATPAADHGAPAPVSWTSIPPADAAPATDGAPPAPAPEDWSRRARREQPAAAPAPAVARPPLTNVPASWPEQHADAPRQAWGPARTPADGMPVAPLDDAAEPRPLHALRYSPWNGADDLDELPDEVSAVQTIPGIGVPRPARGSVSAQHIRPDLPDDDETLVVVRRRAVWELVLPLGPPVPMTGPVLLLGRRPAPDPENPEAQLVPIIDETRTVSKRHARLSLRDDRWWIVDLGSTNGVVLATDDGAEFELEPGVEHPAGDRFLLGDAEVRIQRGPGG